MIRTINDHVEAPEKPSDVLAPGESSYGRGMSLSFHSWSSRTWIQITKNMVGRGRCLRIRGWDRSTASMMLKRRVERWAGRHNRGSRMIIERPEKPISSPLSLLCRETSLARLVRRVERQPSFGGFGGRLGEVFELGSVR